MEIVIGIIIGLAIGFFVGKLMEAKSAGEEKTQLVAKAQVLAANIEQIKFVRFVRLFVRPSVRGARLSSIHLSSAYP